jgi:hypothetical protein
VNEGGIRLLALVAAVGLVAGALVLRSRIDDSDSGGSGGGGGGDAPAHTLVCSPELEDACNALGDDFAITIEDAVTTADALVEAKRPSDAEADLWLTTTPWAEAVAAVREGENADPILGESSDVIARSPVMLVVREDRATAFETACAGEIGWKCVGEAAGQPWANVGGEGTWGVVRAGLDDPSSASGLPVLGSATGGYLGLPDYATNDFDNSLANWLDGFAASASNAGTGNPVSRMLTEGAGVFAAVGALETDARVAAGRSDARLLVPQPIATADLVVVPVGDTDPDEATDLADNDDLLGSLAELGWRVPDHDTANGVDTSLDLPRQDGLPNGAVLRALLTRWLEL